MSGHRIGRINEDIKRELSAIFRTLKDPRISSMITVLRVDVTNDLSYATIHVSTIEGEDKTAESVKGLKSAQGYIRISIKQEMRFSGEKCKNAEGRASMHSEIQERRDVDFTERPGLFYTAYMAAECLLRKLSSQNLQIVNTIPS